VNSFLKDILTGALFIVGIFSFISGLFVFSAATFAAASTLGTLHNKAEANS
jgi:hypothetical protein